MATEQSGTTPSLGFSLFIPKAKIRAQEIDVLLLEMKQNTAKIHELFEKNVELRQRIRELEHEESIERQTQPMSFTFGAPKPTVGFGYPAVVPTSSVTFGVGLPFGSSTLPPEKRDDDICAGSNCNRTRKNHHGVRHPFMEREPKVRKVAGGFETCITPESKKVLEEYVNGKEPRDRND